MRLTNSSTSSGLDADFVLDAGKSAEFGLDDDAVIMGILHDLTGQGDIILKALGGSVDHNGGEAAVDAGFAELERVAVVKVQRDGDLGVLDDGGLYQLHQIGVVGIGARTLGDLQDNGALELTGRFGDTLNDLHIIDVERADGVSTVIGFREHFFRRYQWHFTKSPFLFHSARCIFVKNASLQIIVLIISSNISIIKKHIS